MRTRLLHFSLIPSKAFVGVSQREIFELLARFAIRLKNQSLVQIKLFIWVTRSSADVVFETQVVFLPQFGTVSDVVGASPYATRRYVTVERVNAAKRVL
ncbi:hypothetical protein CDAR_508101 [Caerostris darwini]|uniref:Uncharacterized protein n=1 Tax=Caerostris darwini TaxID=1538125 RepID=A0AAV4WQY0_9ARAC|nr:hypothetical protein CDAR_508101 [Caerostris darwini]